VPVALGPSREALDSRPVDTDHENRLLSKGEHVPTAVVFAETVSQKGQPTALGAPSQSSGRRWPSRPTRKRELALPGAVGIDGPQVRTPPSGQRAFPPEIRTRGLSPRIFHSRRSRSTRAARVDPSRCHAARRLRRAISNGARKMQAVAPAPPLWPPVRQLQPADALGTPTPPSPDIPASPPDAPPSLDALPASPDGPPSLAPPPVPVPVSDDWCGLFGSLSSTFSVVAKGPAAEG
jgi:hypothetical protein